MEEVRELAKDLSRVKRSDVLPWDEEKDAHEKEHEEGYELERTEGRDMEGVLNGMNGLGMQRKLANGRLEEAMDDLESRLKDLEARVKASR